MNVAKKKKGPSRRGTKERDARYEAFCVSFAAHNNAAQAARDAGYSEDTAKEQGCALLTKPNIKARIKVLQDERNARVLLEGDEILLKIKELAVSDPRRLLHPVTGAMLPPAEWPDDIASCVASFEVIEKFHPLTGALTGYVKKVKLWDKPKSQENLGRNKGLFTDIVQSKVQATITQATPEQIKAALEESEKDR